MLDDISNQLLAGPNYAAFTTLLPGGQPSTHIMWVGSDGTNVLINTKRGRQKVANVTCDPRVVVTVFDSANTALYTEIRGRVVEIVGEPEAKDHFDELSRKYTGASWANPTPGERVMFRVRPERVRVHDGRKPRASQMAKADIPTVAGNL
jgi:PPOX class probable F420-dependent enzyme